MRRFVLTVLAIMSVGIAPAFAGEKDHGPNGGPVIDAGGYHVELVAKGAALTLYVTTHEADAPVPTTGASGFVVIQSKGGAERLDLAAAEPNQLTATAKTDIAADAKIAVTFTIKDQKPASGRFDLSKNHEDHDHAH
jgi:hypothetical protein